MSSSQQVQYFNPFLILIWILQVILFAIDYSDNGRGTWSIPVIGSFFLVQVYMVWKTNSDEMKQEQQLAAQRALGGSLVEDTPIIQPGITNLSDMSKQSSSSSSPVIHLGFAPGLSDDDEKKKSD